MGGGGRIGAHGMMDGDETKPVEYGDECQEGQSDRSCVKTREDESGAGDEVGDPKKTQEAEKVTGRWSRKIQARDVRC